MIKKESSLMTIMYGIANCDTIKKAKLWLETNGIAYEFHDYKKQGADSSILQQALNQFGSDTVMNKRGTTYRKLSDEQKEAINENTIVSVLSENTSMIKRPILVHKGKLIIGFKADTYAAFFNHD
jgi:Spx/MgsR family transcriptional regulator